MAGPEQAPRLSRDFVAAIDFGGTKIAIATATPDGGIVESTRIATEAAAGAGQAVERALEETRGLIAKTAEASGGRCLAVGAVSPGIVEADRILFAPNVPGWGELALPALVRGGLGIDEVHVGTDVKAAALAESRWGSLRGADPALFLYLGTGFAAGILVGGRVIAGAHGAAGEVGYSLRAPGDGEGVAHGRAPLEEVVAGRGIGERASALFGEQLTAADVLADSRPEIRAFADEAIAELSFQVANMAIFLDPERIAVGGGLMSAADRILPAIAERLAFAVPFPPELVEADFVHDGSLRGAIALALDSGASVVAEMDEGAGRVTQLRRDRR